MKIKKCITCTKRRSPSASIASAVPSRVALFRTGERETETEIEEG